METKKVVILIDGQNLYYNLKDLDLLEKDIDWTKFFKSLLADNDELVRTYWFRAQKILDSGFTKDAIKNQFYWKNHRVHYENYKNRKFDAIPQNVKDQEAEFVQDIENWINAERKQFNIIEYAYDQLSVRHEDIEMVKKGVIKIDPYKKQYLGEKGVDVAVAVKMIALSTQKKCDKIILISGDYDYAEAINFVKDNMTKIHIVRMHKGYPPKSKSMSRELSILADKLIDVYEEDIRSKYMYQVKETEEVA